MNTRLAAPGQGLLVRRTKPVSPSKLGVFSLCPLRYVLETENDGTGRLPYGLKALRGTAAHRVIEQLSERPHQTFQELREAFCSAVAQAVARQDTNSLIRFAFQQLGVNALFPAGEQASTCQFIRKVLARYVPGEAAAARPKDSPYSPRRAFAFGRERKLVSAALDMEGWVDLVYKDSAGTVHVCDFKTGNVLDASGEPKLAFLLQISCYGLLAKEMLGLDEAVLELVGPASGWHGMLSGPHEIMARQAIAALQVSLPKLETVQGESLATPGSWCASCSVRPTCPAYIHALEGSLAAENILSPVDVAGTVTEILATAEFLRLRILTHSGKRVSLSGIPASIYPGLSRGMRIYGYSLGSYDVLARAAFPANFYLFRPDNPKGSAFSSLLTTELS